MSHQFEQLKRSIGGRPRIKQRKERTTVYLDPETLRQLKERAETEGRTISEIIRTAVQT